MSLHCFVGWLVSFDRLFPYRCNYIQHFHPPPLITLFCPLSILSHLHHTLSHITHHRELYMGRLHRMDLSLPIARDKAQQVSWTTIHRVCGEISVSRSIGDPDYKRFTPGALVSSPFSWPATHDQVSWLSVCKYNMECCFSWMNR